ncbi:MAG: 30S ribosomal protein S15 [Candidatus Altiarchaeota archaeon]
MARMHARKKGKSSSKKPVGVPIREWVSYSAKDLEEIIVKLGREGKNASAIGLTLRDQYGVPSVRNITKRRVTSILKKNDLAPKIPDDLNNLIKNAVKLRSHLEKHVKDKHNRRGLTLMEAKIHRLSKYYRSRGYLPESWRYDPQKAKLEGL